jgi:hypothetical protein
MLPKKLSFTKRPLLLALVLSVSPLAYAHGPGVPFPERDISTECGRQAGDIAALKSAVDSTKVPANTLYTECLAREKKARVAAKRRWAKLTEVDQRYCGENTSNYLALEICIAAHGQ